jgi:IMP dehydrogenase/GMP reductase
MKDMERKFDLDDIAIIPTVVSEINSRSECQIFEYFSDQKNLPLMASPMDTVVCEKNLSRYINEGIIPCMPRGIYAKDRGPNDYRRHLYFQSFGLAEIEYQLQAEEKNLNDFYTYPNILIDIANGHMHRLVDVVKKIKSGYPDIKLMVGNVAHPLTYKNLAMAGADFVRCSIGTGAGCTTAANVAINYPMGSLISECRQEKIKGGFWNTKIVADGGARDHSDVIKALALGADYVMMGSIFNKSMESAGFNYLKTPFGRIRIKNYDLARSLWKWGFPIYKKYRGMSTKSVQRSWGKTELVTAEGITKYQKVEYTLKQWVDNFKDYLSSNMSYSGAKTLDDFIGYAEWVFITERARKRFEK